VRPLLVPERCTNSKFRKKEKSLCRMDETANRK
jgi:hypothetical protein